MTRSRIAAAAVLACALALAACGGDDAPSKAEYIKQADAICKRGDAEILAAAQRQFADGRPTQEEIVRFSADVSLPNIQQQLEDLRALDKPEGDEDELEALYDSLEQSIARAKADPASGDASFAATNAKAKAYGFTECGSE